MNRYWIELSGGDDVDADGYGVPPRYWCTVWDTTTGKDVYVTAGHRGKGDALKEAGNWVREVCQSSEAGRMWPDEPALRIKRSW